MSREFRLLLRVLGADVDGTKKVPFGLSRIRGVGPNFAQAVVRVAHISPEARIGGLSETEIEVRGYHQGSSQARNTLTIIQSQKGYREWTRHAPCWAGSRSQKQGRHRSDEGYQELERNPTFSRIESERPANKNHWSLRKSCGCQEEGTHGSGTRCRVREEGREEGVILGRP